MAGLETKTAIMGMKMIHLRYHLATGMRRLNRKLITLRMEPSSKRRTVLKVLDLTR